MKHTKEEIINALKVIQEECSRCDEGCFGCPFYKIGCIINNTAPSNWMLNTTEPETWRAFK